MTNETGEAVAEAGRSGLLVVTPHVARVAEVEQRAVQVVERLVHGAIVTGII